MPPSAGLQDHPLIALGQCGQRHGMDPVGDPIVSNAGIQNHQAIQSEVLQRVPHRRRQIGTVLPLGLYTDAPANGEADAAEPFEPIELADGSIDETALLLTEQGKERRAGVWCVPTETALTSPPLDKLGPEAADIGAAELAAVWKDPDFQPAQRAFYYARVIEIPTPRWTAYEAKRFNVKMTPDVPMTTQERAYTSPIWYTP